MRAFAYVRIRATDIRGGPQLFVLLRSLSPRRTSHAPGRDPIMQRRTLPPWLSGLLLVAACGPAEPALAVRQAPPTGFQAAAPALPQPGKQPKVRNSKAPTARAVGYTAPRQNFVDANIPPPTRFIFESQKADPVAQALTLIARETDSTSPDQLVAGKGMQALVGARSVVRSNAAAALKLMLAALAKLPADDVEAHIIAFQLLGEIDSQAGAIKVLGERVQQGKLRAQQTKPAKAKQPAGPKPQPSEHIDPEALIRQAAIRQLYRAARAGRPTAGDYLLKALTSPHPEVRVSAVQLNYSVIPGRLAAKAKMQRYLAPAHRYLLNHY